jgi:hypothetical protein
MAPRLRARLNPGTGSPHKPLPSASPLVGLGHRLAHCRPREHRSGDSLILPTPLEATIQLCRAVASTDDDSTGRSELILVLHRKCFLLLARRRTSRLFTLSYQSHSIYRDLGLSFLEACTPSDHSSSQTWEICATFCRERIRTTRILKYCCIRSGSSSSSYPASKNTHFWRRRLRRKSPPLHLHPHFGRSWVYGCDGDVVPEFAKGSGQTSGALLPNLRVRFADLLIGMTFVRRAAIEQAGNIFMLKAGQNLALCRSQLFSGSRSWRRE